MDITPFLRLMVEKSASDLFFYVGAPVHIKIEGHTKPIGSKPLKPGAVREIAYSIMTDEQTAEFEREREVDLAISVRGVGRFRANIYRQRGEVSMVVRFIRSQIPNVEDLNLPALLNDLVMEPRGLILVVGATGSGKSTSLAAMIDYRNTNASGHILSVEDPIEFIHKHKRSVVGQREIGLDTNSYSTALRHALREAPDVILIGEIRDQESMRHALHYAEAGTLCLSTLHANNANGALDRVVNFFPEAARPQLLMDLSHNLRAIISQRLVRGVDGKRVPAVEVLLNTSYVSELIGKAKFDDLKEAMAQGNQIGMQTFDQALFRLYQQGRISEQQAIHNADSKNNLALQIRLSRGTGKDGSTGLSLNQSDLI